MDPAIRQHALPAKTCGHTNRNAGPPGGPHQAPERLEKNDRINAAGKHLYHVGDRRLQGNRADIIHIRMMLQNRRGDRIREDADANAGH